MESESLYFSAAEEQEHQTSNIISVFMTNNSDLLLILKTLCFVSVNVYVYTMVNGTVLISGFF